MPACGQSLLKLASVSTENRYEIPEDVQIRILADVVVPYVVLKGATYIFASKRPTSHYVCSRRSGNPRLLKSLTCNIGN